MKEFGFTLAGHEQFQMDANSILVEVQFVLIFKELPLLY